MPRTVRRQQEGGRAAEPLPIRRLHLPASGSKAPFCLPIPWKVRRVKKRALRESVAHSLLDRRHRKEWKTLPGRGKDLGGGCRTPRLSRGGRAFLRLLPDRFQIPGTDRISADLM